MIEDNPPILPPPGSDPSPANGEPLPQDPNALNPAGPEGPVSESQDNQEPLGLTDYEFGAKENQEKGVVINQEIAQALHGEVQSLLAQGLSGTEVAQQLGRDTVMQQRGNQLLYMMGKDLPGREEPLTEPAPEWDGDEYWNAKCAVVTELKDKLSARDEEYQHITERLLENDLSYRDVLGDEAKRAGTESDYPEHAQAYADALTRLMLSDKGEDLKDAAKDIRQRFNSMRAQLPASVELSPHADSQSWILWDIGKQEVLKDKDYHSTLNPEQNYAGSVIADPGDKESAKQAEHMKDVVTWRHMGWELHHKAFSGEDVGWLDSLLDDQTRELLHKVGDEAHHGQLSSSEYTDLGCNISTALNKKFWDDHPDLVAKAAKHADEILQGLKPKEPLPPLKNKPEWFDK